MQSITPITASQLLGKVQKMLYKFEILDDTSTWIDLCTLGGKSYLTSLSLQLGGAGVSPDPIAATWSAEINNKNGIFHPLHPTSAYAGYFRVGRKVRISVGAKYGSGPTSYYWQRLIGWMDVPKFDHSSRSVSLSGSDYSKALTDAKLGTPDNYWGEFETFDSVSSPAGQGTEIYIENDACDIGATEANNVTNWADSGGAIVTSVASTKSNYALQLERDGNGPAQESASNSNCGSVTAAKKYRINFDGRVAVGSTSAYFTIYGTTGGSPYFVAQVPLIVGAHDWHSYSVIISNFPTGAVQCSLSSSNKYALDGDKFQIDNISIQEYNNTTWMRYAMPVGCNGVYYVTLNGVPVWEGDTDGVNSWQDPGKISWHYSEGGNALYFNEDAVINTGSANLLVYYYTDQILENLIADLLVASKLYANQTAALAAMDYTSPGLTIKKVWFDAGSSALAAIQKVCERCNYRFWFAYNGTPSFQPAPTAGTSAFDLTSWGHLSELSDYQDLTEIKNHITIEGVAQASFAQTGDKQTSGLTSTDSNPTSVGLYGDQTESIKNNLFQDQASLDAMVATLLAAYKDPRWYAELTLANCPVPLEMGDTITWVTRLSNQYNWPLYGEIKYGEGTYEQAAIENTRTGIVRDISISGNQATYKVEVVPES